ncbi:anthranilate synthase component I [Halocatena pleomorpha]|uniref:Anthranilate synthase component 1 n=1 Tax=Halocatena pleomorpha TaxID=1785090 RepID=A0A3P3R528_9EURY|nr:anthranilate synthase component I [Halocatena pleomorpha]RRJ28587.1 anthranilate synthase component I [Halocatena pleomorpha]
MTDPRSVTDEAGVTLDCSREAFIEWVTDHDRPIVAHVAASLDVDVSSLLAYATLNDQGEYGFLLESAEKVPSSDPDGAFTPDTEVDDRHARYSFVGYDPAAVITANGADVTVDLLDDRYVGLLDPNPTGTDVLDRLNAVLPDVALCGFPDRSRRRLDGGLVGVLAYDAVYDLFLSELEYERPETRVPDAAFVLSDSTLVFDQCTDSLELVFTPVVRPEEDADALYTALRSEATRVARQLRTADDIETGGVERVNACAGSRETYEQAVRTAKEHVLDGDIYQGVISRQRDVAGEIDPLGLYSALREINPSPYMYVLDRGDSTIVGASPETLVSVQDETVAMYPLAGTCDRGESPVEDRRLAGEMLADEKERAEHTMLVDLARNDVRRVSEPGSVSVEEFMNVFKYSHVQHIESTVTGMLAEDANAFDATRAAFPAGTLTGAPKIRAMELIDTLESQPRGVYGGGLGYYSWNGDADLAIVIRTATIEHGSDDTAVSDRITVQAGAGIVADSDPAAEYEETEQKMNGVLTALDAIEAETTEPRRPDGETPR